MAVGNPKAGSNQGNVSEKIDERILRLLGLEDVFDLDYDTYLTLLKERLVSARMTGSQIPVEEDELLREEYKKVRGKTGRFKVNKKKINVNDIKKKGPLRITKEKYFIASSVNVISPQKLLPGSKTADVSDKVKPVLGDELENNIAAIKKSVFSIFDILKNQFSFMQKERESDRKASEGRRRKKREEELEKKPFEKISKAIKSILAPVKSIWDKIINFIVQTFLGRVVFKLIDWFADPANKDKIQSIIRFVKDWWPALLGAYLLFGTSFGGLIRFTIGWVSKFIFQLGRVVIPSLLRFIANPIGAGLALFSAGALIPAMFPGTVNEQERKTAAAPGSNEDKIKELEKQKANLNLFEKLQGKESEINEQIEFLKTGKTKGYGFASGGFVSGEKGVDKVPAMLSDGEFVMSRGAVDKFGLGFLEALNTAGGGNNRPKILGGVPHAAGGGQIGSAMGEKGPSEQGLVDRMMRQRSKGIDMSLAKGFKDLTNSRLTKNPLDAVNRFIQYKFGSDPSKPSTWGDKGSGGVPGIPGITSPISTPSGMPSMGGAGSAVSNSMKAVDKLISGKFSGMSNVKVPSIGTSVMNKLNKVKSGVGDTIKKMQERFSSPKKPGEKGFIDNLKSATYRDAGAIYAKQMLGGMGGPLSEQDLSKESQAELQKAIARAKKRTGSEIAKAEAKIKELEASGASKTADGKKALATQRSFLSKLKAGGIRVQYTDYNDEKGKLSESAKNAKNILGQFWATERSKKEGGGYRIEDKYDFDMLKKKDEKTGKMRDMNTGELLMEGVFGKGKTIQQRLQAAHLLNPFKGKGDVDMVLGGRRTAQEAFGLAGSKTTLGAMLGMSGKPKDKNTQALEAKRPWWDKAGWFGGGSRIAKEQAAKAKMSKRQPPKSLTPPPPRPPAPVVTIKKPRTKADTIGKGGGNPKVNTPRINAQRPSGTRNAKATHGIK
jgi:hypothetical protein